jgi:hypothetical protein
MHTSRFQRTFLTLLVVFLSILSISGTIALRNLLHVAMLGMLLWCLLFSPKHQTQQPREVARLVPWPLYAWCAFLLLFPLWSADPSVAWINLRGQWGESILTWLLALGTIFVLRPGQLGLWELALVSAAPVFLHILLLCMAWIGLLGPVFFADPSLASLWFTIRDAFSSSEGWKWQLQPFPMGFRGVEPMHGNLGYPASQAMAIALACAYRAWSERAGVKMVKACALIGICFLSVLIAGSRGAVYFSLILIVMAIVLHFASSRMRNRSGLNRRWTPTIRQVLYSLAVLTSLLIFVGALLHTVQRDERWYSMWDKLELGWVMDNSTRILCEGLSDVDEAVIRNRYGDKGGNYVEVLKAGILDGDGARVLLMRAGFDMLVQYPWGLDGSRQAYQKRILQVCGHPPVLAFSHAHQAWINLGLAFGWLGMLLFAWLLVSFAIQGWRTLVTEDWTGGFALVLLASFWGLRGFVDAVYQDHYLQMQAFFLLFLSLDNTTRRSRASRENSRYEA